MSSTKRRVHETDLDLDRVHEHDHVFSIPSSSPYTILSKLPRRESDEDKAGSASSSRHMFTKTAMPSAAHDTAASPANPATMAKHEDEMEAEIYTPRKARRDKGKGKMRYLPELPEEVWRRIWSIYYQDCATRWHDKLSYTGALLPLLISPEQTRIALPVLYAYPLLSYDTITPFLSSLSRPSSFHPDSLAPLVRNLCVQATPERIDHSYKRKPFLHACLGDVLQLVSHLTGFTLKDTLIMNATDGRALFAALKYIRPKKARLELTMWNLHDSPFGQDLVAATQQSVHCHSLVGINQPIPAVDRASGHFSSGARLDGGTHYTQEAWRNALWRGNELDLPAWWISSARPAEHSAPDQNNPMAGIGGVIDLTEDDDDEDGDEGETGNIGNSTPWPSSDLSFDAAGPAGPSSQGVSAAPRASLSHANASGLTGPLPPIRQRLGAIQALQRAPHDRSLLEAIAMDSVVASPATASPSSHTAGSSTAMNGVGATMSSANASSAPLLASTSPDPEDDRAESSTYTDDDSNDESASSVIGLAQRFRFGRNTAPGPSHASAADSAQPGSYPLRDFLPKISRPSPSIYELYDHLHADHLPPNHPSHTQRLDRLRERDRTISELGGPATRLAGDHADSRRRPDPSAQHGADRRRREREYRREMDRGQHPSCDNDRDSVTRHGPFRSPSIAAEARAAVPSGTGRPQRQSAILARDRLAQSSSSSSRRGDVDGHSDPAVGSTTEQRILGMIRSARSGDTLQWSMLASLGIDPEGSWPTRRLRDADDDPMTGSGRQSRPAGALDRGSSPVATTNNPQAWENKLIERTAASHALARALRDALARLLQDWCPTLEALSFVAFDPLASLVVRSPDLDFWVNIPVPHIRVRLPRAINSLAVFKGAKECAKDRARAREATGTGPPGYRTTTLTFCDGSMLETIDGVHQVNPPTAVEGQGVNTDVVAPDGATGPATTQGQSLAQQFVQNMAPNTQPGFPNLNTAAGPSTARVSLQDAEEASRVVGGDGHGGGLVHPDVRIFEIEVNTTRELGDEIWEKAGWQLPTVLCRMLVGQDWDDVKIGMSTANTIDDDAYSEPHESPESAQSDGASFEFDSDWDDGESGDDGDSMDVDAEREEGERGGEVDSTFDAAAARAQAERIAQRRKEREEREEGSKKHE